MERVYPGHGERGTLDELVSCQIDYLRPFGSLIEENLTSGVLHREAKARVIEYMKARYCGYLPVAAIPDLLEKNVEPIPKELAARSAKR